MTKALKRLLLAVLALCVSVFVGIFAVACNTDKGNEGGDNKPPVTGNEGGNEDNKDNEEDKNGDDENTDEDNKGGDEDNDGDDEDNNGDDEDNNGDDGEEEEEGYTITLNVGNGKLPAGAASTYTTDAEGLIKLKAEELLPEPECNLDHWHFVNWYTAETEGTAIDETEYKFTADTTIYAVYARDNGVWDKDGNEFIADLTLNTGETTGTQYWLGDGVKINLNEGDEISLYLFDELITFNVHAAFSSSCIDEMNDTSSKITSVTVSEAARFAIYLWDYADDNGEFWSCQFLGTPLSIATTSTIPEGCEPVKVVANNGTATLYLVINGVAVNSENAANYQIHGWQDSLNNIFGEWNDNPTLDGNEDGEIVVDANLDDDLFLMFHWNGGQSGSVSNVTVGGTFIVKIVSIGGDKITVKAYDENGPEDTDEDEDEIPQLVVNGYYLSGDFNSWGLGTDYYIDENEGLTLTLNKGQSFQAMVCTGTDGSTEWPFSAGGSFYKLADENEGEYFVVSGNNIKMSVTGEYTITYEVVDVDGEDKVIFTITPADGLEPAEPDNTEYILSYFIKGNKVTGWANKTDDEYKMTLESGIYTLTIDLEAGDEFMFYMMNEHPETHAYSTPAVEKFIQSGQLADGVTCVEKSGYNFTSTVAGTYTFTYNLEENKLTVSVVADDAGEDTTPDAGEEAEAE